MDHDKNKELNNIYKKNSISLNTTYFPQNFAIFTAYPAKFYTFFV